MTEVQQKLFDISYKHIIAQGKPSLNEQSACCYRTANGLSCGAAPFINQYFPNMEGKSWDQLARIFKNDLMPEAVNEAEFVLQLQYAHDNADFFGDFLSSYKLRMDRIAEQFGLTIPQL